MNKKIRVGVLFGGTSAEHEVSLLSAKSVIDAIDTDKYEIVPIAIRKSGEWYLATLDTLFHNADDPALISLTQTHQHIALVPQCNGELYNMTANVPIAALDVIFPVLHGPGGEDGSVQGYLTLANIPFVGAGILGSAIGMDKDVMKRLLRDAGIASARFLTFKANDKIDFDAVTRQLGLPLFIKPANMGSSVGVSKVHSKDDFQNAIDQAFLYDTKILIEETIIGREIECAVLGNSDPFVSIPGEIIPNHEFYSYEAKYLDENGAGLKIPAVLPKETTERIQALAIKTFQVLECEGMGRVDFFVKDNGEILVIEINTIPGFTKISMYPQLMAASGISYTKLIDQLIFLAVERHTIARSLRSSCV